MKNKSVKRELNPIQQSLFSKLKDIMLVDQRRLSARIHGIGKIKSQEAQQAVAAEIQQQIEQAQLRVENRKSAVKNPIVFPDSLPVSQRKAEIQKLLSEHQVISLIIGIVVSLVVTIVGTPLLIRLEIGRAHV